MKLLRRLVSFIRNLPLTTRALLTSTPDRTQHTVPYVSQFANPAWAEMVLKDDQPLDKDLDWKESGAKTIEEYERWALTTCGMACTAMALRFFNIGDFKTIPLAKDASNVGVYTQDENKNISSMQYKPYISWVKKFGIRAHIRHSLSYKSICYLLSRNQLIIASVNPNLRGYETAPKTQVGGHLVLLTGYNKKTQTITLHNPSGFQNSNTQESHTMELKDFKMYFAGRGISLTAGK